MTSRSRGVIVSFDEERGFGFIRAPGFSEDVFVHISAVVGNDHLRPGHRVQFVAEGSNRGPRAVRVWPGGMGLPPALASAVTLIAAVAATSAGLVWLGTPWGVGWLVPINLSTLAVWAWDKHRAARDGRRVPEAALLGLAAIGGTLGAIVGVLALHHKRRKSRFIAGLGAITIVQVVLIAILFAKS